MSRHQTLLRGLLALCLVIATSVAHGASVLERLPSDALGFVVVRDLASFDIKAEAWLKAFNAPFPGPLAFLKLAAGVSDGLHTHGELLVAAIPGERLKLCVWIPVNDYDRMITSLHGTTQERIAAVTIAGEDVLMAKQGDWALVMDPDQRAVMEALMDATPAPPPKIVAWKPWIETNDVTAVLLPGGIRTAWAWLMRPSDTRSARNLSPEPAIEDPFGEPESEDASGQAGAPAGDIWAALRNSIRIYLRDMPKLGSAITEAEAIAVGFRSDEQGNALAGVKVACHDGWLLTNSEDKVAEEKSLPPSLFNEGEFVLSGAGRVPTSLATAAASVYVRLLTSGLRSDFHTEFDDEAVSRLQDAVERAVTDVHSAEVLRRPGENKEGVYTNGFLAVRVGSSADFVAHAADVMRLWNEMSRAAGGETRLVFETDKPRIADREATHFSIDMAAAMGAPGLPEVRQSMEQLFGTGGKLRIYLVPIDKNTVLLATATEEQTATAAQVLALGQTARLDRPPLQTANQLLPQQADSRLFFSPHGYTNWLKRQMDAVLGPIIGGPIVRQFPKSAPVGVAGGFGPQELWIDAAVPVDTIHQAAAYLQQR